VVSEIAAGVVVRSPCDAVDSASEISYFLALRLVVLGGGPMGSELAQAFRRLGSEVDLVNSRNNLLPKDEPETGEVLRRQLHRQRCFSGSH
jgi:pyruvate/2-oxoglutarate dehydrogenase complex dihydrolipoamide dehydrogenase (E3) component